MWLRDGRGNRYLIAWTERCRSHEIRWKSGDGKVIWQLAAAVINGNG